MSAEGGEAEKPKTPKLPTTVSKSRGTGNSLVSAEGGEAEKPETPKLHVPTTANKSRGHWGVACYLSREGRLRNLRLLN